MKDYKVREFRKILRNNGYKSDRICGSHEIWTKTNKENIVIPCVKLNNRIARRLIKENNLVVK